MGGESGVIDVLKHRGGKAGLGGGVSIPKKEIVRMLLRPKNFAEENVELLQRIPKEGHTLGVHAWKHRAWTRSLDTIPVKEHMRMATEKYRGLFGKKPAHFVSPGFRVNRQVLEGLDELGYAYASDLPEEIPFRPEAHGHVFQHVQVPVTLKADDTSPLFEYYSKKGWRNEKVVHRILMQVLERDKKNELATVYLHDVFEGTVKPQIVDQFLRGIKKEGVRVTTFEKLAREGKKHVRRVLNDN